MRRIARFALLAGIVVAVFGMSKLHAVGNDYSFTGSTRFSWAIGYILLLAVATYAVGLPDLPRGRSAWLTGLAGVLLGAAGISVVQLFVGDALLPRLVVFGSALVLVPWCAICAGIAAGGRSRAEERDRVVVVGTLDEGETLRMELDGGAERPAQLIAALSVADARGSNPGDEPMVDVAISDRASVIVLTRDAQADDRIVGQAAVLHESGIRVRTLANFYEEWLGKLPLNELERLSLMFDIGEVHRESYARVKRVVDVILMVPSSIVLLIALPFVVIGDLIANRGPLFYRQPRVGKDGRVFTIVKFRTMRPTSSGELSNEWTGEDDPRITSFGRVLRRTHVDELPQVLSILRGDLSIVGPRPEQPHYVDELRDKIPFYDLRHLVRPGLTGWAQVKFGYAGDERDALEKLQYDFWYLRHQCLTVDSRIIGRTLRDVAGGGGR